MKFACFFLFLFLAAIIDVAYVNHRPLDFDSMEICYKQMNRSLFQFMAPITALDQLKACLKTLVCEQHQLNWEAAASTLSSVRLKQQIAVATRYYTALVRHRKTLLPVESSASHVISQSPDIRRLVSDLVYGFCLHSLCSAAALA